MHQHIFLEEFLYLLTFHLYLEFHFYFCHLWYLLWNYQVQFLILEKEDDEGRLILSVKRALYEKAWEDIQTISDNNKSVKGTVIESVKGGLIVDIGVRGFLPASLIDVRRVKELSSYVGEEIEAKVLELDKQRNNIVLSRKAHLEEELSEERQGFLGDLQVGDIKDGKISSIVNFGAFVDIGGMDGLVHVSELSWRHVENPNEIVKVGDSVTIKVLEIDNDKERISLSIKQVTEDPWLDFELNFNEEDVVDGKVTKVVPFGAFVTIGKGVEGLVHVSEISVDKIDSPELALAIGQSVNIKILELDIPKRRVNLSIKQADPNWKSKEEEKNKPKTHSTQSEDKPAERQTVEGVDESLENILQELQVTSAPISTSVSIKTAVWIVMCRHPAILAPFKGFVSLYCFLNDISPGISASANVISFLPQSARSMSLTL